MNQGYIYIITYDACQRKHQYKIGRTGDASKLHSRYRTYFPTDPIILLVLHTYDCHKAEDEIFQKLDAYRIHKRKEWFMGNFNVLQRECQNVVNSVNNSFGYLDRIWTGTKQIIKANTRIKKRRKSEYIVPYLAKCALFKGINYLV